MATLNVRLDDKLKNEAYAVLEKLNITPTEAVRLLFQYVAENGRMPVKTLTVSDSEEALLRTVRNDWPTHKRPLRSDWMNYELAFDPRALKEWQKLGVTVREQFKKSLRMC